MTISFFAESNSSLQTTAGSRRSGLVKLVSTGEVCTSSKPGIVKSAWALPANRLERRTENKRRRIFFPWVELLDAHNTAGGSVAAGRLAAARAVDQIVAEGVDITHARVEPARAVRQHAETVAATSQETVGGNTILLIVIERDTIQHDAARQHTLALRARAVPAIAEAFRYLQQIAIVRFRIRPLLLQQGADLRAGQADNDKGVTERHHGLVLAHIGHQIRTCFQVLADAAIIHQADLCPGRARAEQGAVGHHIAQRRLATTLGIAAYIGHGNRGYRARQC